MVKEKVRSRGREEVLGEWQQCSLAPACIDCIRGRVRQERLQLWRCVFGSASHAASSHMHKTKNGLWRCWSWLRYFSENISSEMNSAELKHVIGSGLTQKLEERLGQSWLNSSLISC